MAPVIHMVRHAQGLHNLGHHNSIIRDPDLTELGEQQCRDLQERFPHHGKVTHLVASPLRRTINTCLLSFAPVANTGKKIVVIPDAQEISAQTCDIGLDREDLEAEFREEIDASLLFPGWNDKSPSSKYAPTASKLDQRTLQVRLWLQNLVREAGDDACIVLVAHAGILHFITQMFDDIREGRGTGWENTEYRSYKFVDPTLQDPVATLRELESTWKPRRGDAVPLTASDQADIRTIIPEHLDHGIPGTVDGQKYWEKKCELNRLGKAAPVVTNAGHPLRSTPTWEHP